jgi:hypothetical protein
MIEIYEGQDGQLYLYDTESDIALKITIIDSFRYSDVVGGMPAANLVVAWKTARLKPQNTGNPDMQRFLNGSGE